LEVRYKIVKEEKSVRIQGKNREYCGRKRRLLNESGGTKRIWRMYRNRNK
jgi:hypothetical protein